MISEKEIQEIATSNVGYFEKMNKLSRDDRIRVIQAEKKIYSPSERVIKGRRREILYSRTQTATVR